MFNQLSVGIFTLAKLERSRTRSKAPSSGSSGFLVANHPTPLPPPQGGEPPARLRQQLMRPCDAPPTSEPLMAFDASSCP